MTDADDGWDDDQPFEYVDTVSPHIVCAVCTEPFVEPVRLNCGHVFCRRCLTRVLASSNAQCPLDRIPLPQPGPPPQRDLIVGGVVDDLRVRCPNKCAWTGPRSAARRHAGSDDCPNAQARCPHREFGCAWAGRRTELATHLEDDCHLECVKGLVAAVRALRADLAQAKAEIARLSGPTVTTSPVTPVAAAAVATSRRSIEIGNTHLLLRKDQHQWRVIVRGGPRDNLAGVVTRVKFTLDKSFPDPVKIVSAPPFELGGTGWGTFPVNVKVTFANGHTQSFLYPLQFDVPERFMRFEVA
jgi:hypothetical protein